MRKVPVDLLDELIAGSKNQVVRPVNSINSNANTASLEKQKEVAEGIYNVEVVSVKCSSTKAYKLELKILSKNHPKQPILSGYCRRYATDCSDLNSWFGEGEKITFTGQCKGKCGTVYYIPTNYGWFMPFSKDVLSL